MGKISAVIAAAVVLTIWQQARAADAYTTTFPVTEDPISEHGMWRHETSTWKHVKVIGDGTAANPHRAVGNDNLVYDDAYAHLTGFAADQSAEATIWIDPTIPAGEIHEAELHLRWAESGGLIRERARGYELYLAYDGAYYAITRWNGAYGDFTTIAEGRHLKPAPKTGDTLRGTVIGNTIRFLLDRHDGAGFVLLAAVTDPGNGGGPWPDGDPGMGFCQIGTNPTGPGGAKFGFVNFTAHEIR